MTTAEMQERFDALKATLPPRDVYEYQVLEHVLTIPGDGVVAEQQRQRTYERAMMNAPRS